jgi:hypothetical protein
MIVWFEVMTLLIEAARVIDIRVRMMALGQSTPDEMLLMVTEKYNALEDAGAILARGGNPSLVVDNYRRIVSLNLARLSRH